LGVIGLVSEWMGCSVEDLSIVVLAHELAHAYTQVKSCMGLLRPIPSELLFAKHERRLAGARLVTDSRTKLAVQRVPGSVETLVNPDM
jgi:hypothetical protein